MFCFVFEFQSWCFFTKEMKERMVGRKKERKKEYMKKRRKEGRKEETDGKEREKEVNEPIVAKESTERRESVRAGVATKKKTKTKQNKNTKKEKKKTTTTTKATTTTTPLEPNQPGKLLRSSQSHVAVLNDIINRRRVLISCQPCQPTSQPTNQPTI